jgi:hypothetical protein
MDISNNPEN